MDEFIEEGLEADEKQIELWKWVSLIFREHQQTSLDVATFQLLRNIDKNMERIDIPTAIYNHVDENYKFLLWLKVHLPVPEFDPKAPPE